ncbi:hypothetical protein ACWGMA_05485 [Streptomyces asiaticus]
MKTDTGKRLPWTRARNVGFGFSAVGVRDAASGAVCRIYVGGKLKDHRKPDAKGRLSCSINLQGLIR